ncbi:MAG: hypothetical protein U1E16_02020 [Hyphomicrobiales bacterium]
MRSFDAASATREVFITLLANFRVALRLSWPWLAVFVASQAMLRIEYPELFPKLTYAIGDPPHMSTNLFLLSTVTNLLELLGFASISMNWNRFVLRGENPIGIVPVMFNAQILRYFAMLLMWLCLAMVAVILFLTACGILISVFAEYLSATATWYLACLISAAFAAWLITALMRLLIRFPAISIGRSDFGVMKAWRNSKGYAFRLFAFFLYVLVFTGLCSVLLLEICVIISGLTRGGGLLFWVAWPVVFLWTISIVGASTMTVLYRSFAQERDD